MDSKKATFDSFNNINLLKDYLEIMEGLLEFYKGFFYLKNADGDNRWFIIDFGFKVIDKYEKQWIKVFDDILIFDNNSEELIIKDIKEEEFYNIVHGIEKNYFEKYELFYIFFNLQIETFIERNSNVKNIELFTAYQYEEEMECFNIKSVNKVINKVSDEVYFKLNTFLKSFNKYMNGYKSKLIYLINHKNIMNLNSFKSEVILLKEDILNRIEVMQEKIKIIIEDALIKNITEKTNRVIEENLNFIIKIYKKKLNTRYILEVDLKKSFIGIKYDNKLISKEKLCKRCVAIIEYELKYLNFIKYIGTEAFRILQNESEAILNNIFYLEFKSALYDVEFSNDFNNVIEGYKVKSQFILNNMTSDVFNKVINYFNEINALILKNKIFTINNLYIFKPINYMDNISIYEVSEIVQLQRFLIYGYRACDLRNSKNNYLNKINKSSIGLNNKLNNTINTFNLSIENMKKDIMCNDFQENKLKLYEDICILRNDAWENLNSELIKVFKLFNNMIEKSIKEFRNKAKTLENYNNGCTKIEG